MSGAPVLRHAGMRMTFNFTVCPDFSAETLVEMMERASWGEQMDEGSEGVEHGNSVLCRWRIPGSYFCELFVTFGRKCHERLITEGRPEWMRICF